MRWIALCGLVAVLSGCGWTQPEPVDPEQAVRDALSAYRDAELANDAVRICAAFSAASRAALENSYGGKPCPRSGSLYQDTEAIHVRRWKIRSIAIRGDRATVRLAPGHHVTDRRLELVHESGGWKLERSWKQMTEQAGWEHCVLKLTADTGSNPAWKRVGASTHYDYTEAFCDGIADLKGFPSDAEYDRVEDRIWERLVAEGKLTRRDVEALDRY